MEIQKILSSARLKSGKTMQSIESLTGVLAANQSKIELGNNKNPGFNTVAKLAKYYQLDLNEVYKATQNESSDALVFAGTELPTKIPLLSINEIEKWINADRSVVTEDTVIISSPVPCSKQSYAMIVSDDSMTSFSGAVHSFPMGYTIIVDPVVTYKNNSFVIVKFKEDETISFRQAVFMESKVYFKCINTQYQILTSSQKYEILGVVVGTYRRI